MANYYGRGRSNYFKVKDKEAFKKWCAERLLEFIENGQGQVGFIDNNPDGGGFVTSTYDDEIGEFIEFDLADETAEHLADGEVAILMEAGHEKARYVSGWAVAVNWKGRRRQIVLSDIEEKAQKLAGPGVRVTQAVY